MPGSPTKRRLSVGSGQARRARHPLHVERGRQRSPLMKSWEGKHALERCPSFSRWPILWYAESAFVIADSPVKLQDRCRTLVSSASEHWLQFADSLFLEYLRPKNRDGSVDLIDGRCFTPESAIKILGVVVDSKGSTQIAVAAR